MSRSRTSAEAVRDMLRSEGEDLEEVGKARSGQGGGKAGGKAGAVGGGAVSVPNRNGVDEMEIVEESGIVRGELNGRIGDGRGLEEGLVTPAKGPGGTNQGGGTGEGNGGEGQNKRKDRSPTLDAESDRRRRRLNEFDLGVFFGKIEDGVRQKAVEVIASTPEAMKGPMSEGLGAMINAIVEVMNGLSDGLTEQRIGRETLELKMEDRLERLEEKVKDVTETTDGLTELRIKSRNRDSVKAMERKVDDAMCTVKLMNIDLGRETTDKREIVRKTVEVVRSYVAFSDKEWFERVMKKTRIIILGKGTRRMDRGGTSEYNVPTLFQCRDRGDAEALEGILRGAGYHPTFHWPSEILEFIWAVKGEVRKTGIDEKVNYFKVRPERRDGGVQIRVEVKAKEGGTRFTVKGIWACPPIHRYLWDSFPGLLKSKIDMG